MIYIYTDGGCSNNPKSKHHKYGAWAFVVIKDDDLIHFDHGDAHNVTSNIMELTAITKGLQWLRDNNITDKVIVLSDSKYCITGLNLWLKQWIDQKWYSTSGKPIANQQLWQYLNSLKLSLPNVTFKWVRGHAGNQWNEMVDQLCWDARGK